MDLTCGHFVNPFTDIGFKIIFGQPASKELLITLLNELLAGEHRIENLIFLDKENHSDSMADAGIIYDLYCLTDTGEYIIVEMQKKEQRYFVDRALYYSAKAIVEQAQPGEWDFHLTPVYTVCFMDFIAETGIPCQFRTDIGFGLLEEEGSSDKVARGHSEEEMNEAPEIGRAHV